MAIVYNIDYVLLDAKVATFKKWFYNCNSPIFPVICFKRLLADMKPYYL